MGIQSLTESESRISKPLLLALVIFVMSVSGFVFLRNLELTPFHGDESGWISAGNYYADLLLKGDFDWTKWDCRTCGTYGSWGSINPPLGKLVFGLPLSIYSNFRSSNDTRFAGYYQFNISQKENEEAGNIPPSQVLFRARMVSIVFGLLCCLLLFLVGTFAFNWQVGLIASLLPLTNTVFVQAATRAMPDMFYDFLLVLTCLFVILLPRAWLGTRGLILSALAGISMGLAGSVKVTGIVIGGLFFVSLVVYIQFFVIRAGRIRGFLYLVVFLFGVLSTTYLLNPYYWPSFERFTLGGVASEIKALSRELAEGSITQGRLKLLYADMARELANDKNSGDLRDQYPILSDISHPLEFPLLYVRWYKWLSWLENIDGDTWDGNRFVSIQKAITVKYSEIPFEFLFLGIGIVFSGARTFKLLKRKQLARTTIPFAFFAVNYLFILVSMKLNEDRWYLPAITASEIIAAVGLVTVVAGLIDYSRGKAVKLAPKPSPDGINRD